MAMSGSSRIVPPYGRNLHGMKPRIFLGSSGKQAKLVQALTRGLSEVADVEPWTTVFNPGVSTLDRLVELTREVDFAAFVFAQDDWTTNPTDATATGQASPRDDVVFEAGLFGGALGMRRTFILHAKGAKLPTDLLGMTAVRFPEALTAADMRTVNQKLRKAIEDEGRLTRIEGDWWRHSLTVRSEREPSAISLSGSRAIGRAAWRSPAEPGRRTAPSRRGTGASPPRSAATRPASSTSGMGSDRGTPNAPQLEGTGEIRLEEPIAPRLWTTRSDTDPQLHERTAGVYLRADPDDMRVLDDGDPQSRVDLLALRLKEWKAIANS